MEPALKIIRYRGGVVTLRIPESWVEEYDRDGGAVFIRNTDPPNLRLDVISASGPATTADTAWNALRQRAQTVERRADGTALIRFDVVTEERGTSLRIRRWEIAQAIPPNHLRIVIFSWTILASQAGDAPIQQEGELLDREIRAAVLAPELGITGARDS